MKKSILIFVKNVESLNNFIRMLRNKKFDNIIPYSKEVEKMIIEYAQNEYEVYLATLFNFDVEQGILNNIYQISTDKIQDMSINEINDKISFMIIRNLGSVEANFNMIQKCLNFLLKNYKGTTINDIKSMLKGMTKNYLVEVDSDRLSEIGMATIPTKIFSKKITFAEICNMYPNNREDYLIKPVTGELSNSLTCLSDVNEEFFRRKENKVGGWVVQPIQKDIWNGEFQISFLNGEPIYAQEKTYPKEGNIPNQKSRTILKFHPTESEISIMKNVIKYFSELYNLNIILCRIDFMKDSCGVPKLLEFEMVNPGFFIGYMEENDADIKRITTSLRKYCDSFLK